MRYLTHNLFPFLKVMGKSSISLTSSSGILTSKLDNSSCFKVKVVIFCDIFCHKICLLLPHYRLVLSRLWWHYRLDLKHLAKINMVMTKRELLLLECSLPLKQQLTKKILFHERWHPWWYRHNDSWNDKIFIFSLGR